MAIIPQQSVAMRKQILFLTLIFWLVLFLPVSSQNVSKDTSETEITRLENQLEDVSKELDELRKDNYDKAMKNAERSIGLANFMIQVLIGAVAILGAFGIFSYIKTGQMRKSFEAEFKEMEEKIKKEFEKTANLRGEIESRKTEADSCMKDIKALLEETKRVRENIEIEAKTVMKDIKTTYEEIKKVREEIERDRQVVEEKERSVDKSKSEVSAFSLFTEGVALSESERYVEAIEKNKKATELKPDFAGAYCNWGLNLSKLGRHAEAIEKHKKATELEPKEAIFWFNLGCAYSLLGNKAKALESLANAISLDPSYKENAKKDEDFENLWNDEDFKKLVE